jgi:lysophospholipase L1-like esterase
MKSMKLILLICLLGLAQIVHTQKLEVSNRLRFLALGDSYTVGQGVNKSQSWPYQFKSYLESAGVKLDTLAIIAQTGWTTGNLKTALQNANTSGKFNLVFLLIGVNNQYQGLNKDIYVKEFEELLKKAIEIAGGTENVFVLSIPDYGYTPFGEANQVKISAEIDEYNAINISISQKYQIAYFDITPISRMGLQNPTLVASDGLHPSGEMYALWVQLIGMAITIKDGVSGINPLTGPGGKEISVNTYASNNSVSFQLNGTLGLFPAKLSVYSIIGSKILEKTIYKNLDILLKNKGIYIYRLQTHTGNFTGKIFLF